MVNKSDYVELGLACANVCKALERGLSGKELDTLSPSVREAVKQLTRWVEPGIGTVRGSLTTLSITGPWRRFTRRSQRRVEGTRFLDFSTPRMIKKLLGLGS